jgi:hypothetical protein
MWDKEVEKNLEANAYSSKYHTKQKYMTVGFFKRR